MEGLAGHLVVEVHLYAVLGNLYDYARDYAAHRVKHRDSVAGYEKVLANLTVNLECRLRKVYDPVRIFFSVSVCR